MAVEPVRFAGVTRSVMIALVVVGVALGGCRPRQPEDPERALAKRRAALLAGSRALVSCPQAVGEPVCPAPRLQIGAAGVTVSIYPSNGLLAWDLGKVLDARPLASARSIWRQVVVPRAGVCPSVRRRRDGRLDGDALTSLLRAIVEARPRCPPKHVAAPGEDRGVLDVLDAIDGPDEHVLISLEDDDTPMYEIVEVVDAAAAAGLRHLRFLHPSVPPADCTGAITPAVLRERLAAWRFERY
jgi:hypothetical protein